MIVVDTNILVYLGIDQQESQLCKAVYAADPKWVLPNLWEYEFRNVLASYVRFKKLRLEDAVGLLERTHDWLGAGYECPDREAVLKMAVEFGCSAYDCEYVVLAKHLGVIWITYDRLLLKQFPAIAVHPKNFV